MPLPIMNPPVEYLPEYVPSRAEADRNAAMPSCSVTWYRAAVGGAVRIDKGLGSRCPKCGGVHLLLDLFQDDGQADAALQGGQVNVAQFVREEDGVVRYALGNAAAGATLKGLLGFDVNEAFGVRPLPLITKDIDTDDPRFIKKG